MTGSENNSDNAMISYLPEDVIANILMRLPADYLHAVARCVCKTWARILRLPTFIESQILRSDCCLLIQRREGGIYQHRFLKITERKASSVSLNCPIRGRVMNSSEGIILISEVGTHLLFAANPATMQLVQLPRLPSGLRRVTFPDVSGTIVPVQYTGEIKVLCEDFRSFSKRRRAMDWYITTVSNNMSWKKLNMRYLNLGTEYEEGGRISVGGILYLSCKHETSGFFIFAMNLCSETTHRLKGPFTSCDQPYKLMRNDNNLCCVTYKSEVGSGSSVLPRENKVVREIQIWELKDLYRNKWSLVKRIGIPRGLGIRCNVIAWLHHQQMLIFEAQDDEVVAFCERTGKWRSICRKVAYIWDMYVHTSSLVSW